MLICFRVAICFDTLRAFPAYRSDRLPLCPLESKSSFQLCCPVYFLGTEQTFNRIAFATWSVDLFQMQLRVGRSPIHLQASTATGLIPRNSDSAANTAAAFFCCIMSQSSVPSLSLLLSILNLQYQIIFAIK